MFQSNEVPQFPSSSCAPQDFQGVSEFFMRRSISYSGLERADEMQPDDDMSDDGMQMLGEKKRRLNIEQVKALEKSFELGNKLEPERKIQLARALGLKPRQVAIWFQNRRARWKTKQLERDYDVLRKQYDAIKADNDVLKSQNKKLQAEVMALENKDSTRQMINLNKDNEGSWSNGSDQNSCDVNLNMTSTNNNTVYSHSSNKNVVPFAPAANNSLTQLLHGSSNEGYCNMFGGIEENTEFWPWHEQ